MKEFFIKLVLLVTIGVCWYYSSTPVDAPNEATPRETKKETISSKPSKKKKKGLITPQEYKERFWAVALMEEKKYGIPKEIKLGKGILESRTGNSDLVKATNNHFSIKCFGKNCPPGHCKAFGDDKHNRYIVYENDWESFRAHSHFIHDNKRYSDLFNESFFDILSPRPAYERWAYGLKEAGYATDKDYAKKLIKVIEDNRLYER